MRHRPQLWIVCLLLLCASPAWGGKPDDPPPAPEDQQRLKAAEQQRARERAREAARERIRQQLRDISLRARERVQTLNQRRIQATSLIQRWASNVRLSFAARLHRPEWRGPVRFFERPIQWVGARYDQLRAFVKRMEPHIRLIARSRDGATPGMTGRLRPRRSWTKPPSLRRAPPKGRIRAIVDYGPPPARRPAPVIP